MEKVCTQCSAKFEVTDADKAVLQKMTPTFNGNTYPIPEPTLCFTCRLQRKLAYYNSRNLYRRTCDKTGAQIVSMYSPDKDIQVYEKDVWFSDAWDPLEYGRDYDFERPFFEQWNEFFRTVPLPSLSLMTYNHNTEYGNDAYKMKNCYLVFDGEQAEDCYYGSTFLYTKNCMDFLYIENCELCYECTHCSKCYHLMYSRYCQNCSDSYFLRDCIGCKNCFGCANLHQKQYCIYNEQKTKEEYEEFIGNFQSTKNSEIALYKEKTEAFFASQPSKAVRTTKLENSTGDNLNQSRNAIECYDSNEMHDCAYCTNCLMGGKDSMDIHTWGDSMELCYEGCLVGNKVRNIMCSMYVYEGCSNVYYSAFCTRSCNNLFGCVGLRHKQYCIFNKQYSEEEYQILIEKIVQNMVRSGEWGEFFPSELSILGYNETVASFVYPLTQEQALAQNLQWSTYEAPVIADKTIPASQLPDSMDDIPDDVLNWAIVCEETNKPFKIIKKELEFYREHKIPIPHIHPDQRHVKRYAHKNPYTLYSSTCKKCSKDIQTTYNPDRPEVVYCGECYLKEVY